MKSKSVRNLKFKPCAAEATLDVRRILVRTFPVALVLLLPWNSVRGEDNAKIPPAVKRDVDFVKDIQPLFKEHCLKCHGENRQRGDFRLDDKGAALKGGESFAPAIIPGDGAASPLVRFTAGAVEGMEMPPEGERALSRDEVSLLRAWIDQGAKWPDEPGKKQESAPHWSFQPVVRPEIPEVAPGNRDWTRSPVDAFIAQKLEQVPLTPSESVTPGLKPSPDTDRITFIRRATFDITGLPPTPAEVMDFVGDQSPDAFERLIDRLLASPHFGERWARHWLDTVKFAESNGFETNQPRPAAWPYRDYVIRAFNEDKPFDQFLFEQLAGDTVGIHEATGFLVAGAWDQVKSPDPTLTSQQRADELHDMVSTTGSAFFGLTVGCARCHNHKFDPISHSDYHAMKGVFAGVVHGNRPYTPPGFEDPQPLIEELRGELANLDRQLGQFEPLAFIGDDSAQLQGKQSFPHEAVSTLLLDDLAVATGSGASVTVLVPPIGSEPYRAGKARGELNDSGDMQRYPNLGRSYSYWNQVANRDVFTWNPGLSGRWRLWLSWGCGWNTHAADATYVLDRDGDLGTKDDQTEIARVDQRKFADGTGGEQSQPLWSGLYDAGVHEFTPTARVVLRGGEGSAYVTADVVCFQRAMTDSPLAHTSLPRLRSAVQRRANSERFPPIRSRFVKLTIEATTGGEPCLDELEVFEADNGSQTGSNNVALASVGTIATASSSLPGYDIHRLANVNDGRYGNSASWISNEPGQGWVMLEFPEPVVIDRIVWSRDRPENGQFQDRIPSKYRIEAGMARDSLQLVASSEDRIPADNGAGKVHVNPALSEAEFQLARKLQVQGESLRSRLQKLSARPIAYAGQFTTPEPIYRLHRGDPMQPKERMQPAGLASFGKKWQLNEEATSPERRRALANWINDPDHPLTMRVMVNRLWQYHFGQGLVQTPSDFGRNGTSPSHPQLLDWMASEARVMASPKRIHRQMLTSSTYRQSSHARPEGLQADAATRLLWRYPPRRLEAEPLRDAILAAAGNLDDRMFGPGFDLFEANTNYVKVYNTKQEFGPAEWRRMVYQSKPRMQLDEVFGQFDCPDAGQIAPKRTSSITALQALNLLNSRFAIQQARQFSNRLANEMSKDPTAQVRQAFLLAYQREPSSEELADSIELIQQHGLESFCRAILNSNEFLFVF
ncbi:PSD1 and planctomycete cytochrome C domain-containing protein [Schlesneria sp. T3-172]|uniref:PSD1 and planctomycete cytochrome C domain-containing protein n=1 Tax=Schlesneria sphaerica TaxID=3373610 RepID=UPI0037C9C352